MKFYKTKVIVIAVVLTAICFAQNKKELRANLSQTFKKGSTKEIVLARVGSKVITVQEFYERSEYTIRPQYAKGNSELEKKIILNSLIAEKMLALEKEKESKLFDQKKFHQTILGRKEQMMRHLLFYEEGYNKVKIDSAKFVQQFKVAGREYDVEFVNIKEEHEAQYIQRQLFTDSVSFKQMFTELTGDTIVPHYNVKWNSPEYPQVSEILYNEKNPEKGKIYGPLKLDETYLFFKVKGWTDKPAFTHNQQTMRYNNVKEKLLMDGGVNEYAKFIHKVMKGKKLEFDRNVFFKVVNIFAPVYNQSVKDVKEKFADRNLKKNEDVHNKIFELGNDLAAIKNEALMTIDGKIWTVEMFADEIAKHPLVFRNKNFAGKDFPKHFKLAIVDLIRDKYLTEVAYERGLDKEFIVERTGKMWTDALVSFYEQNQMMAQNGIKEFLTYNVVKDFFTPYIEKLQKKYSDQIEVNIDAFVKLKLTRIDMFALEKNVPYPIIVPAFPNITVDYHLDYGKKMDKNK